MPRAAMACRTASTHSAARARLDCRAPGPHWHSHFNGAQLHLAKLFRIAVRPAEASLTPLGAVTSGGGWDTGHRGVTLVTAPNSVNGSPVHPTPLANSTLFGSCPLFNHCSPLPSGWRKVVHVPRGARQRALALAPPPTRPQTRSPPPFACDCLAPAPTGAANWSTQRSGEQQSGAFACVEACCFAPPAAALGRHGVMSNACAAPSGAQHADGRSGFFFPSTGRSSGSPALPLRLRPGLTAFAPQKC